MESLWKKTEKLPSFASLHGEIKTDVLIIGGGMAGVLCAYWLQQAGIDYVLAEANEIGMGVTKNTTAKITSQHGLIYADMIKRFGIERTKLYLKANEDALHTYQELCREIECDFENKSAVVYSLDDRQAIEKEVEAVQQLGFPAEFSERVSLPFSVAGAIRFPNQAQFHPLKFLAQIANSLHIFEHTEVRELIKTTAVTDHGKIHAKRIIVTTHFPFLNKHGSYFIKLYQSRSYVLAVENAKLPQEMYLDAKEGGFSFRSAQNLLLIGCGSHRPGKKSSGWYDAECYVQKYEPQAIEKYRWATQDCMTLDNIPYIGAYSAGTENLYVATGFHKWGMTSSMVAAKILTDVMLGKKNEYASVFSPSRSILRPQLACNAFEAVTNLLSVSPRRCPHMGCALHWNRQERSWDCPCHGSRFDENGKLIDNPATGDLKPKE
ncbi:MAG: FAD-dependent oxidoreductase [Clostridia bacterium]|nr:FAD-dependent oxidoreductase [Clostridia bacterium]